MKNVKKEVVITRKYLKELREKSGMTQFELAEALNVSQSAIALWETGKSRPSTYKLPELAKILGCRIDDLFA